MLNVIFLQINQISKEEPTTVLIITFEGLLLVAQMKASLNGTKSSNILQLIGTVCFLI